MRSVGACDPSLRNPCEACGRVLPASWWNQLLRALLWLNAMSDGRDRKPATLEHSPQATVLAHNSRLRHGTYATGRYLGGRVVCNGGCSMECFSSIANARTIIWRNAR